MPRKSSGLRGGAVGGGVGGGLLFKARRQLMAGWQLREHGQLRERDIELVGLQRESG